MGVKIGLTLLSIGAIAIILSLYTQRWSIWPPIGAILPEYIIINQLWWNSSNLKFYSVFSFWTGIIFTILGILSMIAIALSGSLPGLKRRMMLIEMLESGDRIKIDEVASSLGIKPTELEEIISKLLAKDLIRGKLTENGEFIPE